MIGQTLSHWFRALIARWKKERPTRPQPLIKMILRQGADQESLEELIDHIPVVENLLMLDLSEYRSLVEKLSPPTDEQIRDFAAFIAEAKSWYKHLPLLPPGVPFCFFIDPNAGMDRVIVAGGRVMYYPRTEESPKLHYSWLTTETYRSRFGYLSYACPEGSRICVNFSFRNETYDMVSPDGLLDNNPYLPAVNLAHKGLQVVPAEILGLASVEITGVIHPMAATVECWDAILKGDAGNCRGPEETGATAILGEISARCQELQELRDSGAKAPYGADPVLSKLMAPERERLQNSMIDAMRGLRRLLYGL
jgi:hypothetical protein